MLKYHEWLNEEQHYKYIHADKGLEHVALLQDIVQAQDDMYGKGHTPDLIGPYKSIIELSTDKPMYMKKHDSYI